MRVEKQMIAIMTNILSKRQAKMRGSFCNAERMPRLQYGTFNNLPKIESIHEFSGFSDWHLPGDRAFW